MIQKGDYVVVRCTQAGVHAGELYAYDGQEVELEGARRLWYWRPAHGAYLSAVASYGLHEDSKLGAPVDLILTEACEIILCSEDAADSIREHPNHNE